MQSLLPFSPKRIAISASIHMHTLLLMDRVHFTVALFLSRLLFYGCSGRKYHDAKVIEVSFAFYNIKYQNFIHTTISLFPRSIVRPFERI